jgi:hypothetical protein
MFDQGDSVQEWADSRPSPKPSIVRAGYFDSSATLLRAAGRNDFTYERGDNNGFRVASVYVVVTQIIAPEMDLQDGEPLKMTTVRPGGDGEVGALYGIWLRDDGLGGAPNYRWSISGGPEALPDTLLVDLPDTDLDGAVDDYFLIFARLAEVGANDRVLTEPYTLRLDALDSSGLPIADSESEILLQVPEPAAIDQPSLYWESPHAA